MRRTACHWLSYFLFFPAFRPLTDRVSTRVVIYKQWSFNITARQLKKQKGPGEIGGVKIKTHNKAVSHQADAALGPKMLRSCHKRLFLI